MSLYGFIRVGMKKEKMEADIEELRLKVEKQSVVPLKKIKKQKEKK